METPFFYDAAPGPSGIDVLSDILRVFHVTGAALLRGEFGAPWASHAPSSSRSLNFFSIATRSMSHLGGCMLTSSQPNSRSLAAKIAAVRFVQFGS
jgi:hypothetical protein